MSADRPPEELIVAGSALAIIVGTLLVILIAVAPRPALPSIYGCYSIPGTPLMRLSTGSLTIEGQTPLTRAAQIERTNIGFSVQVAPAFYYVGPPGQKHLASPNLLPQETGVVFVERASDVPELSMLVGDESLSAPKVACPKSPS